MHGSLEDNLIGFDCFPLLDMRYFPIQNVNLLCLTEAWLTVLFRHWKKKFDDMNF